MGGKKGDYDSVEFPKKLIKNIELIDQNLSENLPVPIL
jgi:excinuclease ABC subunit A